MTAKLASRTRRIVFNRHCLWRLNPAGAFALLRRTKRSVGRVCRTSALIQTYTPKRKTPADGEGLSFGRTRRITRNRRTPVSSLWDSRHGRSVSNAPRVAFVRTSSSNPQLALGQIRKTRHKAGSVVFGRTSQIRTGDLYHVKADWPHQGTRRRVKTSARTMWRQGSKGTDIREKG